MQLSLAQFAVSQEPDENLLTARRYISEAAAQGADLLLLPEGHLTPYFPQFPGADVREYLLDAESPAVRALRETAREARILLAPNIFLRGGPGDKGFSASPLIMPDGSIAGWTMKQYITRAEHFFEADYFLPAERENRVFETPLGRIGILICFDRHFPECFRSMADQGAQLVLIPTANIEGEPADLYEWELRLAARRHGFHIAMCNRTGRESELSFCGGSIVISPLGEVLAAAGPGPQLLLADIAGIPDTGDPNR